MPVSRRTFAKTLAASAAALSVPSALVHAVEPQADLGISHTADAIHQEAVLKATPARVYAALTEPKRFDAIVKLSAAAKSMPLKDTPSMLSKEPGSTFALFGGYITGRQIEVTPAHIVQVWRAASWPAGEWSIVNWRLTAVGQGTKLSMDHAGYPAGEAQHLAEGWKGNYFEPLAKYLAS